MKRIEHIRRVLREVKDKAPNVALAPTDFGRVFDFEHLSRSTPEEKVRMATYLVAWAAQERKEGL